MKTRKHTCLDCGRQFVRPVILTKATTNLSGEATEFCPGCSGRNTKIDPAVEWVQRDAFIAYIKNYKDSSSDSGV